MKKTKKLLVTAMSCSMAVTNLMPLHATTYSKPESTVDKVMQKAAVEQELKDFKGNNVQTVDDKVIMANNGNDNFAMSNDVKELANDFHYSADIQLKAGGENSAGLIFAAANRDKPGDNWKAANLVKEGDANSMRVFRVPWGDDYKQRIIMGNDKYDATKKSHLDFDVKSDGTFVYRVTNEAGFDETMTGKISDWRGGYIGLITWKTEAEISNIKFTNRTDDKFVTNLENLRGLGGIWTREAEGLLSAGGGDNFAVSDSKIADFTYEGNIKNTGDKGAGALMFRVQDNNNPKAGCYVLNVDYSNNIFKLFEFPTGGTIEQVSLSEVEPKADGSYDMKVVAVGEDIYIYANGKGIMRVKDKRYSNGNLGLLTWNADVPVIYQNLKYAAESTLPTVDEPVLSDLELLSDGVTITPTFDKDVTIYGMDVPAAVNTIKLKPISNGKVFITLKDRNHKVTKAREEVTDTYEFTAEDFKVNFLNMAITVENDGFSKTYNYAVNKWFSTSELAAQPNRAQFHVTPQVNFMNDPNGMVYDSTDGYWHLFYQYSPNNNFYKQSQAHVRSKDLVNWEQQPLGIQIDELGLIFSGSAVEDKDNTSGFFTDNKPGESRLVSIFTYHNEKTGKQSQALAYSKDHGVTWVKYKGNPVIPNEGNSISGNDFRDPKVFKVEGDTKWYMVTAGGAAQIHVSDDLINWRVSQNLTYKNGDQIHSECPGLIPAKVNGTGEQKWIYNGSAGFYVVGSMVKEGDTFKWKAESDKMDIDSNGNPWGGFGKYATMTFFEDGAGKNRSIGISWLQDFIEFDGKIYKGAQSLPQEYGLIKDRDGNYVVTSKPVEEVEKLRDMDNVLYQTKNKKVSEKDDNILRGVSGIRYDVEGVFTLGTAKEFGFKLRKGNGKELLFKYDVTAKRMVLDARNAGYHVNSGNWSYKLTPLADGKVKLRIIIDQGAIEAFGNDGEANISTVVYEDNRNIGMEFYTKGGDVTINSLDIYDMKSMYSGKSGSESEETQLYLSAKDRVHVNTEFTVDSNIYPNISNASDMKWSIPSGLTIVKQDKGAITLKATKAGTYKIKATAGKLTKEISVDAIVPEVNTNVPEWDINDNWEITDKGILGKNTGGDSFLMSNTKISKDKPFVFEADMDMSKTNAEIGFASGIVFGVQDKNNPTNLWFCVNIERTDKGDLAKIFKNANGQAWHVDTLLPQTRATNAKYKLKVVYDGYGTLTYYVNGNEISKKENADVVDGFIGVQTFKAETVFDNIYVTFPDATAVKVKDTVKDVSVAYNEKDVAAKLPTRVKVELDNGNIVDEVVTWDVSKVNTAKSGTYKVTGTVMGLPVETSVFVQANKVDLKKAITAADKYKEADYTKASFAPFKAALAEAKAISAKADATQEAVNKALTALTTAQKKLVKNTPIVKVDKKALLETLNLAKSVKATGFTKDSYDKLQKAIAAAQRVYNNASATQKQVDEQTSNLRTAMKNLVINSASKENLKALLAVANTKEESAYTKASWDALMKAKAAAQKVMDNSNANVNDVKDAYANLMDALNKLEVVKPTEEEPTTPKTGDTSSVGMSALMVMLSGGALVTMRRKKEVEEAE